MADYVASASPDHTQLRLAAGSVAAVMAGVVTNLNAAQAVIAVNDAEYFDPIVPAMDEQLTAIADGTFMFSQFTADQRMDVVQHPRNYTDLFANTTTLEADVEAELAAKVGAEAAALAHDLAESLLEQLKEDIVRFATGELLYLLAEVLGGWLDDRGGLPPHAARRDSLAAEQLMPPCWCASSVTIRDRRRPGVRP